MTFIFEKPRNPPITNPAGGEATLGAIWDASINQMLLVDNTTAAGDALRQAYDDRIAAIKQATGQELQNPLDVDRVESAFARSGDVNFLSQIMGRPGPAENVRAQIARQRSEFDDKLQWLQGQFPEADFAIRANDPLVKDAERLAREADERLGTLLESRPGWDGVAATLGGGIAGSLQDPVQIGALIVGGGAGGARTALGRILSVATSEALVNGAVEAAMQPMVQDWRRRAGLPHGWGEALNNIGFAALGGAVLGGALQGAGEAVGRVVQGRRANAALRDQIARAVANDPATPPALARALAGDANAAADVLQPIRASLPAEARGAVDAVVADAPVGAGRAALAEPSANALRLDAAGRISDAEHDALDAVIEGEIRSRTSLAAEQQNTVDRAYAENSDEDVSNLLREGAVPAPRDLVLYRGRARPDPDGDEFLSYSFSRNTALGFAGGNPDAVARVVVPEGTPVYSPRSGISGGEVLVRSSDLEKGVSSKGQGFAQGERLATRAAEGDGDALDALAAADPAIASRVTDDANRVPAGVDEDFDLDDPLNIAQLNAQMEQFDSWTDDMLDMPAMDENGDMVPLRDLVDAARHDEGLSRLVRACAV